MFRPEERRYRNRPTPDPQPESVCENRIALFMAQTYRRIGPDAPPIDLIDIVEVFYEWQMTVFPPFQLIERPEAGKLLYYHVKDMNCTKILGKGSLPQQVRVGMTEHVPKVYPEIKL